MIHVRGRGTGRVNIAALVCYKPGERSRLIYRLHLYSGRKGESKTFGWMDYRDLILSAHAQLGAPIVLIWDNLNLHLVPGMKTFAAEHADWLTVVQFPAYAPDLNPPRASGPCSNAVPQPTSPPPTCPSSSASSSAR